MSRLIVGAPKKVVKWNKHCMLEIMAICEPGDSFRRDALSKPVRHLKNHKKFV